MDKLPLEKILHPLDSERLRELTKQITAKILELEEKRRKFMGITLTTLTLEASKSSADFIQKERKILDEIENERKKIDDILQSFEPERDYINLADYNKIISEMNS